jgi:hypothetical protein
VEFGEALSGADSDYVTGIYAGRAREEAGVSWPDLRGGVFTGFCRTAVPDMASAAREAALEARPGTWSHRRRRDIWTTHKVIEDTLLGKASNRYAAPS